MTFLKIWGGLLLIIALLCSWVGMILVVTVLSRHMRAELAVLIGIILPVTALIAYGIAREEHV